MKRIYLISRTFRKILAVCAVSAGVGYAGIPGIVAQTPTEPASGNESSFRPATGSAASGTELVFAAPAAPVSGIDRLFSGAGAAGVHIRPTDGAPGAAFSILIRGLKSFRGTSEPLFILDGVLLNPTGCDAVSAFRNDESDYQAVQNTLVSIGPEDIEKIEILKDASSTALYGSKGANGVIVITTKMGKKKGEAIVYQACLGLSAVGHTPDLLPAAGYRTMMQQANPGREFPGEAIDWSRRVFRTVLTHSHHISLAGAGDRSRHYLSLGYSNEPGIVKRTGCETLDLRVNFERTIGRNGLIGVRGNFGHTNTDMTQGTAPLGATSTIRSLSEAAPLRPVAGSDPPAGDTPEAWLAAYDDASSLYFVQQAVGIRATVLPGLSFQVSGGIDYRSKERMRWVGSEVQRGAEQQGRAAKSDIRTVNYNAIASFSFDRAFAGGHRFDARLGGAFDGRNRVNYLNEGYKFFKEDLRATGIQLAENVQPSYLIRIRSQQAAAYVSAGYAFGERYTVNAGVRGDYTLRYDDRFGDTAFYPWVSASWNIAGEPFFRQGGIVSALIVRGGWGRSGRQTIDPYLFNENYITGVDPAIDLENGAAGYYDIRWTNSNEEWNAGVEVGLFGGRLSVSAEYYDSKSRDRLRYYYHRRTGEYRPVYANAARVSNRGAELDIRSRVVEGNDWQWSLGATFGYNRNRLLDTGAPDNADVFGNSAGVWSGRDIVANVNRRGESVGAFYGYESQGIVRERHLLYTPPYQGVRLQEGDIKFIDQDGDGGITENDRTVIGRPDPSCRYGFSSRVAWRNLSLTVAMDGAAGFDILNLNLLRTATYATGNYSNLLADAYRQAYPAGDAPRLNAVGADVVSSRFVENGSYLRLSDVQLAYRLPVNIKGVKTIDLAFTAKNVCVVTGYSGYSPLVDSYTYDLSRHGLDNGSYPLARSFFLSLTAAF